MSIHFLTFCERYDENGKNMKGIIMSDPDALTEAQKAWVLFKKIEELWTLLWTNYTVEFRQYEKQEEMKKICEQELPF